ncbi:MAG: DUF305 domain-containing protein [Phycisphaerae bacterium]|nr:DUF305 domain-containing protein [Gemmatimonadaceae bacterium]
MNTLRQVLLLPTAVVSLAAVMSACASGGPKYVMGQQGAIQRARADSLRYPYTKADIEFMSGMIHHHAQAITMSKMAPSHGADPAVIRLTERIINAQSDEIKLMQAWLQDRNQEPPKVDSMGTVTMPGMAGMAGHSMPGHDMPGMSMPAMPGMLSDVQLKALAAARGPKFDELFLTYMIQHHRGAVTMVQTLFSSPGAGQDESVYKFAGDVEVDQSTELKRMLTMMLELGFVPPFD